MKKLLLLIVVLLIPILVSAENVGIKSVNLV